MLIGIAFIVGVVLLLVLIRVFKSGKKPASNRTPLDIPRPAEKKFKRCPVCQSTFTDESLIYCLSDGNLLEDTGGASDEIKTVIRPMK